MDQMKQDPEAIQPDPDAQAFLQMLQTQRRASDATLRAYQQELHALKRCFAAKPLRELTVDALRTALARSHGSGLAPTSLRRRLSAWRSFYRWLVHQRVLMANPAEGLRAPRGAKPLPKVLSPEQAVRFVEADRGDAPAVSDGLSSNPTSDADPVWALRDRALFELMYSCGLRLSELVGLDAHPSANALGWYDSAAGEVVVTGKGQKMRRVPVGRQAAQALAAWLPVREAWLAGKLTGVRAQTEFPAALFVSQRASRLSQRSIQALTAARAERGGLPVSVHPHMLRHSFASHVLQSSGDLRAVQELLGHANVTTTQVYTHLDFQKLAAVYDAAHPRAKRKPGS